MVNKKSPLWSSFVSLFSLSRFALVVSVCLVAACGPRGTPPPTIMPLWLYYQPTALALTATALARPTTLALTPTLVQPRAVTPTLSNASPQPRATATPADGLMEIEVGDYYFRPQSVTVTVGTTIIWNPVGYLVHTIDPVDPPSPWRGGVTAGAGTPTYEFTFNRLGTYIYTCNYHPSAMDARIIVIKKP